MASKHQSTAHMANPTPTPPREIYLSLHGHLIRPHAIGISISSNFAHDSVAVLYTFVALNIPSQLRIWLALPTKCLEFGYHRRARVVPPLCRYAPT